MEEILYFIILCQSSLAMAKMAKPPLRIGMRCFVLFVTRLGLG